MSERADFLSTLARNERAMNAWRRDLRDVVLAAFQQRTAARQKVDTLAYAQLRLDIDRIYLAAYARWPGDVNAPLGRIIRGQTRRTWGERYWAMRMDVKRRLRAFPDLIRAIREAA